MGNMYSSAGHPAYHTQHQYSPVCGLQQLTQPFWALVSSCENQDYCLLRAVSGFNKSIQEPGTECSSLNNSSHSLVFCPAWAQRCPGSQTQWAGIFYLYPSVPQALRILDSPYLIPDPPRPLSVQSHFKTLHSQSLYQGSAWAQGSPSLSPHDPSPSLLPDLGPSRLAPPGCMPFTTAQYSYGICYVCCASTGSG